MRSDARKQWAAKFANSLRAWIQNSEYKSGAQFANQYEIPHTVWDTLLRGRSVSMSTELYALIFYVTSLPESDPRTIPPINRTSPSGKKTVSIQAWTDSQYYNWEEQNTNVFVPIRDTKPVSRGSKKTPRVVPETPPPKEQKAIEEVTKTVAPQTMSAQMSFGEEILGVFVRRFSEPVMQQFVSSLSQHLLPQVVEANHSSGQALGQALEKVFDERITALEKQTNENFSDVNRRFDLLQTTVEEIATRPEEPVTRIKANVIRAQTPPKETDPGELAIQLRAVLEQLLEKSVADRDQFLMQYGKDHLGPLLPLIMAFTMNPDAREKKLRHTGLIKEIEIEQ